MRVLHLIDHMGLGGEQRMLLDLAETHAPELTLSVWSLRARDLPGVPARFSAAGVSYRVLDLTRRPLRALRLRSLLRQARPDLLHLHLEYSALLGTLATLGSGRGRPLLVATVANDPHRQARLHRSAGRLLAGRIDLHLAYSEGIRDAALQAYAGRPRHFAIVAPGIDLGRFDRSRVSPAVVAQYRKGPGPVVGTVARLAAQKAVHVLLDATPFLLRRFPEARVLIVGDGPLRAELGERAQRLGITPAVTFAGYQEDVTSAYAAMDVFVLPSRDEGYGIVFLEAMAMGVPVVGTRVIGSMEAVEDGVTGLLVPYADAPALAEAVVRLFSDPGLAHGLSIVAADRVRRRSSREHYGSRVESLYRDLAGRRPLAVKG